MARKGRKAKKSQQSRAVAYGVAAVATVAIVVIAAIALGDERGGAHEYHPVSGFADVHGIAVNPERPNELYVATHNGLIRGVDDGNWARVGAMTQDLMGFSMHPTNGSTFWVSGHPRPGANMGVRISTDGGFTWETIALDGKVDFHAMTVSPADPANLWGIFAEQVYRSTNGGYDWEVVAGAPGGVYGLAGHPTDAETVYAAMQEGVAVSEDGGRTWRQWLNAPATAVAFARGDAATAYLAGPGGVAKSSDGGESWAPLPLDVGGQTVGYLAIDPTDADIVYAATYQTGIYKTTDGGETWTQVKAPSR